VNQWLAFSFPWRGKGARGGFTEEWGSFVSENYLLYTRILQLFFQRALTFDFYFSVTRTSQKNTTSSSQKDGKSYLEIVEIVLDYFNDPKLLEMLQALEKALLALNTGAGQGSLAMPSPSMRQSLSTAKFPTATTATRTTRDGKPDVAYFYRNSGPRTRQHISTFEGGKYFYIPLFENGNLVF
jgi:hypothetical protein